MGRIYAKRTWFSVSGSSCRPNSRIWNLGINSPSIRHLRLLQKDGQTHLLEFVRQDERIPPNPDKESRLVYEDEEIDDYLMYSGLNLNQDKAASRRQYTRNGKAGQRCTGLNLIHYISIQMLGWWCRQACLCVKRLPENQFSDSLSSFTMPTMLDSLLEHFYNTQRHMGR